MFQYVRLCGFLALLFAVPPHCKGMTQDEAEQYLEDLNFSLSDECNVNMIARWDYVTDIENATAKDAASVASEAYLAFRQEVALNITTNINYEHFDVEVYREFRFLADQGPGGLRTDDLNRYVELQSDMEDFYNNAAICEYDNRENCNLHLEPDLENIMATSTDWDELTYYWNEWRAKTGTLMRDSYLEFADLSNKAAIIDDYNDTGDYWLNGYSITQKEADGFSTRFTTLDVIDADSFRDTISTIWQEVSEKLYKKLHAFVRMKLRASNLYPQHIERTGTLPANILGNMWAQDWLNIADYVKPFEDQPTFDVTDSMIENGWDIDRMFYIAEDFFTSIGLPEMTDDFNNNTVNDQAEHGKPMECHASAEDFCQWPNNTDFRIKMCTEVNMQDLVTVHHEMGHIEYFMAYTGHRFPFRGSANPGFHEAIGDVIALSVSTPEHMENILDLTPSGNPLEREVNITLELVENSTSREKALLDYTDEEKQDINFLMSMALQKIAFLPFGYLIDKYRWGIFDGSITDENLNSEWWRLRTDLQGVSPPDGIRLEEYFDAGAKFHVPANVPYIRYFVSYIVQFQFHQRLCEEIEHSGPLHKCDIYGQTAAGKVLWSALEKGLSEPWPLVLNELGGSPDMNADAIISYFEPLLNFFDEQLSGECIGWGDDCAVTDPDVKAQILLTKMEKDVIVYATSAVQANWNFHSNTKNSNEDGVSEAKTTFDQVYRQWWDDSIKDYYLGDLHDESIIRQFELQQSNIGTSILNEADTKELNDLIASMTDVYSSKFCIYDEECDGNEDKVLTITELSSILTTSDDFKELSYYWTIWRDDTGNDILYDYPDYVTLMNKAAIINGFNHAGEMWLEPYIRDGLDTEDLWVHMDTIFWEQTYPFYQKLHSFVRYKLEKNDDYKDRINDDNRLLPANILGNMWGDSWENIYHLVKPYSDDIPEISSTLRSKSNSSGMVKIAEDFYVSIGMEEMTTDFWKNSFFDEPEQGKAICIPRRWDFYTDQEIDKFRISRCTNVDQENLVGIHREMGQLESSMAYRDQPLVFRRPANPGFSTALGGAIALSVVTPTHLDDIENQLDPNSILSSDNDEERRKLNFLMKQALSLVPMIPYAYILEKWRWNVFADEISPDVYNYEWWKLRIDVQGLKPPVDRTPDLDFDVGANYHIGSSTPCFEYFVGSLLQFQLHERMCELSGSQATIYYCNVYGSRMVGYRLLEMLRQGSSTPWQDQLDGFLDITGANISALAMLNYFEPLIQYMDEVIESNDIEVGWDSSDDTIDDFIKESQEISAVVPVVVGIVFAVMVIIVLIAFCIGQRHQKKKEALELKENVKNGIADKTLNGAPQKSDNKTVEETKMDFPENFKIPRVTALNGHAVATIESDGQDNGTVGVVIEGLNKKEDDKIHSEGNVDDKPQVIKQNGESSKTGRVNEVFDMSEEDEHRIKL